ncbi:MAG: LysE family translocator [Armatimonadetes bacterium]|nr:LysE family translocator [Armatimonadota bacterium]
MALIDSSVAAFTVVALVLTLTPGADTMLVVRSSIARGWQGGARTLAGMVSGGLVHASLAAFGLSAILLRSAQLYDAVKMAGALYLIYLGVQSLRSGFKPVEQFEEAIQADSRPAFLQGFVTNVMNPKVALFYVSFLPQFIAKGDPVVAKTFLLVGIHYTMGIVWLMTVALTVSKTAEALRAPSVKQWMERVSGLIFVGLGARLMLDRR